MDTIFDVTMKTANHNSNYPVKTLEVDHLNRKLTPSQPQNLTCQHKDNPDCGVPKDLKEISSLRDYSVQTATPGNNVDESKVRLAKELTALLTGGKIVKANKKMAEAIENNLKLEGLISENDLSKCLIACVEQKICGYHGQKDRTEFENLIKQLLKLGIDPNTALHNTFSHYLSREYFFRPNIFAKTLKMYLDTAESVTETKFRDQLKDFICQQICLAIKEGNYSDIDQADDYLKLSDCIKIELDKKSLANEFVAPLARAIQHKDFYSLCQIIKMEKEWNFGLRVDSILVPEVKADLEKHLHAFLLTEMQKNKRRETIELVEMAINLGLNFKSDDLKQPMTDLLFASLGYYHLDKLLEIAKILDLNLNKLTPEIKEKYLNAFCTYIKNYSKVPDIKQEFDKWCQEVKLRKIDLNDKQETLDSVIFNGLYVQLIDNLEKQKATTMLPALDNCFVNFFYYHQSEQLKENASLLEIDFNEPEIKDKIFGLCRQIISERFRDHGASSSQVALT